MRALAPALAVAFPVLACLVGAGCAQPADTTGTGGSTGTGGTGAPTVCGPQSPAAASGGANYPFPQHRLSANCGYPTNCSDTDVSMSWTTYKSKMIVTATGGLRVQRPENGNDTVSEGMAYGMLMAVVMADKATFDGLWAFAKTKRNGNGLMSWHLNADGSTASSGGASDADEDMAFALLLADKQWGGGYASDASAQISSIFAKEVSSSNVFLPDDSGNQSTDVNPSYFAPAYYKAFQTASGQSRWGMVADQTYTMLNKCANATTGLVPDWCVQSSGAPSTSRGATGATYGYDAARTPFRIALDACWNADTRAVTYLAKVGAFFNGLGAPSIVDGYNLDGTPSAGMRYPAIAAFVGPAGVSGMPANLDQLMRSAYGRVIGVTDTGTSSAYNYYNASWGILTEMLMTGNFVNLAAL